MSIVSKMSSNVSKTIESSIRSDAVCIEKSTAIGNNIPMDSKAAIFLSVASTNAWPPSVNIASMSISNLKSSGSEN